MDQRELKVNLMSELNLIVFVIIKHHLPVLPLLYFLSYF